VALSAVLGIVSALHAETPQPAPAKKASSTSSKARRPVAKSPVASRSAAAKSFNAKSSAIKPAATSAASSNKSPVRKSTKSAKNAIPANRRSNQQSPSPERLQEIQQALADRGYFAEPVDGKWGASSADALKRFQREQNLAEDGKIGSLSLIALGLGPRRTVPADSAARLAQPQQ